MEDGDAEATSLMRWLGFYAVNTQEDCVSIVLRLLILAFPAAMEDLKALDRWKAVVATLEGFYESNLAVDVQKLEDTSGKLNDTLKAVLELVLGAVVQCEAKEKFVKDILTMEDAVQADLMGIIEKVMAQGAAILSVKAVDHKTMHSDKKEKERPGLSSPLYLSRNASLERMKRENGVLKEENVHLARELEQMTKKFQDMEGEKQKLVEMMKGLKEQVDADSLRMERAMRAQYDERIQQLQLELDSTKAELNDKAALAIKVPALSDEVDLLRPLAEKMKKVDATVAKYKAKIDALAGAKDRLSRLENTNAELVEKNLALESELAKAASWKRKLKEAKEANTVVEFRVSELETVLDRERKELAETRAELETVKSALQESKTLNSQLQESADQQSIVDASGNINYAPTMAGGISEFNPELMQKLTRLEYENAELKKQIDGETGARIDNLLDEIDDLVRLKKSFEKKYFDTQQILQSTQSEFKQTKLHLECTVAELQASTCELSEWQACLEEDVEAHAREKQTVVELRDRLASELSDSLEREHRLTQAVSSQDRELAELREASQILTCRNERLVEQCECLSRANEDLKTKLAQQIECAAMQVEDANTDKLQFQQQKARELKQVCRQYEEQAVDTISRMTLLVDAKSAEIEQLTSRLEEAKLEHDAERQTLEAARASTAKELDRYQDEYSVSNADWRVKEEELKKQLKELEDLCSQCKEQEQALKSTIKSQLKSNARLVEKNKTMHVDAVEKREVIARLESTTTRLESKVALLEKERTHFTTQEERKRDAEGGMSSYSSQLSTQVSLVVAELEKVLKENKKLHAQHVECRRGHDSPLRSSVSDSGQKAKNYYLTRIQQVEHDKQQVEHKRRELLLVNAKLIQEQKQLHIKNASLSNQVHDLEESVNHWRLRDERRRKKEGQPSLSVEGELSFASPGAKIALTSAKSQPTGNEIPSRQDHNPHKPTVESPVSLSQPDAAFSSAPAGKEDASCSDNKPTSTSVGSRKRKLEVDSESARPSVASTEANNDFTDATAFFSKSSTPAQSTTKLSSEPRSKRRLSHFITRNLVSDKTIPETDKPTECKQQ